MKPFLFIPFLLFAFVAKSQTHLPVWFTDAWKAKGLDKQYTLTTYIKPAFQQADFNGDGTADIAVLVIQQTTKKKGILLLHGGTTAYFVFGAGTAFGHASNPSSDFDWLDKWSIYQQKTAQETQFDPKSGDMLGGKTIKLLRPGLLIEHYEDGAALSGGIIYWNGKKYVWVHQGE